MPLSRRQFLKWAGATGAGAVIFNGCSVPDEEILVQSPLELPEDLVTGRDNFYATVAQGRAGSEGLLVRVMEGRAKKVEGNPDYPLNADPLGGTLGRHGLRTEALLQALYHPDRIRQPLVRTAKGGPFRRIDWPEALDRLKSVLGDADPAAVTVAAPPLRGAIAKVAKAFTAAHGSKLMGFDPLNQAVLHRAMSDLFGQDVLPDFDIAHTGYLLSFGADFLGTWVAPTHYSRMFGEFRQGASREKRGHLVQVDSRFSMTTASADEWVYANPGTEGMLALSLAYVMIETGMANATAARALTGSRGAAALQGFRPGEVEGATGVSADRITKLAKAFANPANGPALAIGGGSAAAHTNGTDNLKAIYALNYLAGTVNRPGGVRFNPAAHIERLPAGTLSAWRAELDRMRDGEVQALLVHDANLLYALPGELDAAGALGNVATVISFASFLDETTAAADLILPSNTVLEEWGSDTPDPGPGYASIGFQQPVVRRFRDTMPFGDVLLQVGRELGLDGLPWETMRDVVRDTARTLHEAKRGSVQAPTFEEFWKRSLERGGWVNSSETASAGVPTPPALAGISAAKFDGRSSSFPFYLVPFESQAIGAGELAHLPWLQSIPDPVTTVAWESWVEVNPKTAERLGLDQQDIVIVEASNGRTLRAAVYANPATPPDVIGIPFGQGHSQFTSYAAGRGSNVFDILRAAEDETTGSFAWAGTRARLANTNKRKKLPSLEGIVPAIQLEDQPIIEIQRPNSNHADHA